MRKKLINFIHELAVNHLPAGRILDIIDDSVYEDEPLIHDFAVNMADKIIPPQKYYFEAGYTKKGKKTKIAITNATFDQCIAYIQTTDIHPDDQPVFINIRKNDKHAKDPIGRVVLYEEASCSQKK